MSACVFKFVIELFDHVFNLIINKQVFLSDCGKRTKNNRKEALLYRIAQYTM